MTGFLQRLPSTLIALITDIAFFAEKGCNAETERVFCRITRTLEMITVFARPVSPRKYKEKDKPM